MPHIWLPAKSTSQDNELIVPFSALLHLHSLSTTMNNVGIQRPAFGMIESSLSSASLQFIDTATVLLTGLKLYFIDAVHYGYIVSTFLVLTCSVFPQSTLDTSRLSQLSFSVSLSFSIGSIWYTPLLLSRLVRLPLSLSSSRRITPFSPLTHDV